MAKVKFGYVSKVGRVGTWQGELVHTNGANGIFNIKIPARTNARGVQYPSQEMAFSIDRVTWGRQELLAAAKSFSDVCKANQGLKASLAKSL